MKTKRLWKPTTEKGEKSCLIETGNFKEKVEEDLVAEKAKGQAAAVSVLNAVIKLLTSLENPVLK